mgnify:CR=1 FL=1
MTVIGQKMYKGDSIATVGFEKKKKGIYFIENLFGFEGYMIDKDGVGVETTGFNLYTKE